jgi:hypothetical protein
MVDVVADEHHRTPASTDRRATETMSAQTGSTPSGLTGRLKKGPIGKDG